MTYGQTREASYPEPAMTRRAKTPGAFTGLLTRLTTDGQGNLRAGRLLGIAFLAGLVVAIGTTIAMVAADSGSPATLTVWVLVAFLGVKLPLLGLLWWILGRKQRDDEPTGDEIRSMIARLHAAADTVSRTGDAADRIEILKDEAWYVADHAPDELKSEAAELALRLEALARHVGAPGELPR